MKMNSMNPYFMSRLAPVFLCIGLALATLINLHLSPQTVAYAEWAAALALVCGLLCVLAGREVAVRAGGVLGVLLLLALACMALAGQQGAAYLAYAAVFWLSVLLGLAAPLKAEHVEGVSLKDGVAAGLLLCALLQSLAGLAQLKGWSLGGLVMGKIYLQAFGNIGQANHYADLVFIGLGSLCFLHARKWLNVWWMLALAAWLALAAAASASRSVWLYTFVFVVLGLWALWRGDVAARRAGRALLVVAVCSVLAQMLVAYGHILDVFGVTSALDRAGDAGSNGQRLYNWHAAWLAIQSHPWLGQGPGSFYKASIDAMFVTPPASFPKFAEHAHNLPLNLAVEFGLPMAVLVTGALGWWFIRHLRRPATATSAWCMAVVGVIGAHSMVEYPLWYSYFLIPFGLCMGFADAEDERLRVIRIPCGLGVAVSVVALGGLVWVAHDWFAVREAYVRLAAEEPHPSMATREAARAELEKVARFSVFAQHAESLRLQSWHPDEAGAEEIAGRCDAHWQYKPGWFMMMRCGEAYALAGQAASLERLAVALCDGFPYHHVGLREWAKGFDAEGVAKLKISGRNCL
jgi:O-antigen ligase